MKEIYKVGLTGGIGSGKSFISKRIEAKGFAVFNSDVEAKKMMVSDKKIIQEIQVIAGEKAYSNNQLNRDYLAQLLFSNEAIKQQINAVVHPAVQRCFEAFCISQQKKGNSIVFNEAAILFENNRHRHFNSMVLVVAPKEVRIERVMKRDKCSREDVLKRMKNQWGDEKKKKLADYIILNDGKTNIEPQIDSLLLNVKAKI